MDEDAHFLWESSNPQVATINEKGEITILTNGAVSFTLTALNGNVEKTPPTLPRRQPPTPTPMQPPRFWWAWATLPS